MTSHTLLIAEREIRERRFVFAAAAVAAVLPYMAFFLPGPQKISRTDVGVVGVIFSIVFAMSLALIVGASLVGRELSERRLSFYFTKPVPASSVWFGKLLAGMVLVIVSFTIIAVPSAIVSGSPQLQTFGETDWRVVAGWFGLLLAMLLIGHTASTMVRSRSPRVAIDLALLAVASTAGWFIIRELLASFAVKAAQITGVIIATGLVISVVAGGVWQMSRGRSDARRSHAALSQFLWPAAGIVLAIAAGYVAWLFSAKPSDLISPDAAQISSRWLVMGGEARLRSDYHPFFLIEAANGRVLPLGAVPAGIAAVSRDGNTFAFARSTSLSERKGPFELQVLRIGESSHRIESAAIESSPSDWTALSGEGRLFAQIRGGVVSVHDLEAKRLMASARIPQFNPQRRFQLAFVSPARLRIYELPRSISGKPEELVIHAFELDIPRRSLMFTGEIHGEARSLFVSANQDASRLIVQPWGGGTTAPVLVDGRTLQPIASLDPALRPFRAVWFLRDGRIAAAGGTGDERRRLAILAADGQRLKTIDIASAGGLFVMGEAAPGKVVVGIVARIQGEKFDHTTLVVDADDGRILRRAEHVALVWQGEGPWGTDPRQPPFDAQRAWVIQEKDSVWRWNPITGQKTLLVRTQERSDS